MDRDGVRAPRQVDDVLARLLDDEPPSRRPKSTG
jgi:hypothetical protein